MALSNPKKTQTETAAPPAEKIRVGQCTVSIWENTDEKTGAIRHSVTFDRRYRDKEGTWKSSDSYGLQELLAHIEAATRAKDRLITVLNGTDEEAAAA